MRDVTVRLPRNDLVAGALIQFIDNQTVPRMTRGPEPPDQDPELADQLARDNPPVSQTAFPGLLSNSPGLSR